jgi:circadian clock protein KaiC
VSSGIPRLDAMLGGRGFYRGSSILVSGTAGTGKTSLAAHFVDAACRRKERCLYLALEESPRQLVRNMRSIGIDLEGHVRSGLLCFHAARPTLRGLEMHLATIHKLVDETRPAAVVVDPVSDFPAAGSPLEAEQFLLRVIDLLKGRGITALLTSLTPSRSPLEGTGTGIASLIDTWLLLRDIELQGERNRALYVLKSRGMSHSNQIREFVLTRRGIDLLDVHAGPEGVLTGTSRLVQEAREQAAAVARRQEISRRQRELDRQRAAVEAQVIALRAGHEAEQEELLRQIAESEQRERTLTEDQAALAIRRGADATSPATGSRGARSSRGDRYGGRSRAEARR